MSSAARLRLACVDDLPQVLELDRAIAEAAHWSEVAYRDYVFPAATAWQRKALFVATAESSSGHCMQGFAAASAVADEAELESIAVAVAARRSGVGSGLLQAVQAWARQHGARSLMLEVRSANAHAQAFYASRGFTAEGWRPGYYKDPADDAVLMRLSLLDADDPDASAEAGSEKLQAGREL